MLTNATLALLSAAMPFPTLGNTTRARELVDQIVEKNGFVRESSLGTMSQEVRREVEQALLAKDKKIGCSVLTYDFARSLNPIAGPFMTTSTDNSLSGWRRICTRATRASSSSSYRTPTTTPTTQRWLPGRTHTCLSTSIMTGLW